MQLTALSTAVFLCLFLAGGTNALGKASIDIIS